MYRNDKIHTDEIRNEPVFTADTSFIRSLNQVRAWKEKIGHLYGVLVLEMWIAFIWHDSERN